MEIFSGVPMLMEDAETRKFGVLREMLERRESKGGE